MDLDLDDIKTKEYSGIENDPEVTLNIKIQLGMGLPTKDRTIILANSISLVELKMIDIFLDLLLQ